MRVTSIDQVTTAKAARQATVAAALKASAQAAGLAAAGLDRQLAAAKTPAERAELALKKALMLDAAPPAAALVAFFGGDTSASVRSAWRDALR